ncbi:MAG: D-alanine--D-alanine ligase [Anaerolineales bacterium]|uniref:D-alanine--D-alanine ligase n=1 Tax=Candidatus Desulfolinea nitratireducens TaxID=2841698 RepID=A0A8J6TGL1_9CHLR|nr:D-alanine--D-alanine ligase [Candidatus Desulfolinea nitratireducens]MBL6960807.1 D-alanine--D-alanine ligase [Anaerolineales bacterium]
MTKKLKVAVIFGGRSGEHEVSLMSAKSVLGALDPQKYELIQIGITHEGAWMSGENTLAIFSGKASGELNPVFLPGDPSLAGLYALSQTEYTKLSDFDVVFPVMHGSYGEDGAMQGLLEMADVAYVGAGVVGSAVGMDKGIFKDVMIANGIPVVESVFALRSEIEADMNAVIEKIETLGYPVFVKPANMGSSVGVSKCDNRSSLGEGLMEAAAYDRRILIERGINAREIEISVLGNDDPQASVPGEVEPSREFYSYESKYIDGTSGLLIPAPLSEERAELMRQIAVKAYKAIDCAGMARVDFMIDKDDDKFYLNEVNTLPGFTEISMYPKLWEASGLSYPQLVDRLIELALERKADRDRTERRFRSNA